MFYVCKINKSAFRVIFYEKFQTGKNNVCRALVNSIEKFPFLELL